MNWRSERPHLWISICRQIRRREPQSSIARCEIAAAIILLRYSLGEIGNDKQQRMANEDLQLLGVTS